MPATGDAVEFPAGHRHTTHSIATASKSSKLPAPSIPSRRIDRLQRENRSKLNELLRIHREKPDSLCSVNGKGETKAHIAVRAGDIAAVAFLLNVEPRMFMVKDKNGMVPSQLATPRRNGLVSSCGHSQFFEKP